MQRIPHVLPGIVRPFILNQAIKSPAITQAIRVINKAFCGLMFGAGTGIMVKFFIDMPSNPSASGNSNFMPIGC